jgi:uncharacterized protein (DUF58 family)
MSSILFLLVLFAVAAFLRIDFFFTIFYLFAGVYVLAHLWMQGTARRLKVERHFVDRAFHGDRVAVDLRISNSGWLPIPWLYVHESLPVQLATPPSYRQVFGLGAHGQREMHYSLYCSQRGYYSLGPLAVHAGDLLGVVHPRLERLEPAYLIVYPRVVPLYRLGLPTRSPLVALPARSPLFEDPSRVMGVREYQRGDSPRRIHWTATAKMAGREAGAGTLLVKRFQPAIARETLICLDLDPQDYGQRQRYTATELAIVVAASLANHIVTHEGLPVGLIVEAHDPLVEREVQFYVPPRTGRSQLMNVLEVLARVQSAATTPFAELLRRASTRLSWGATLTIVTGRESPELLDTLVYLRRMGFAVSLILVQPAQVSAGVKERGARLNVLVHRVWEEQDLEMWP